MDDDTLDLLKTVCVAGCVHSAFNCNSNERLEQLENAGLLVVVNVPRDDSQRSVPRRYYRPTEMGKAMFPDLIGKNVA
jgi:hypothetical protein